MPNGFSLQSVYMYVLLRATLESHYTLEQEIWEKSVEIARINTYKHRHLTVMHILSLNKLKTMRKLLLKNYTDFAFKT